MVKTQSKTALISGAYTPGMGSSILEVLREAGWSIIALYNKNEEVELALSRKDTSSRKISVDLGSPDDIGRMIKKLPPKIDAYIHATMFFEMDASFNQEIWQKTMQINVLSAAHIAEGIHSRLKDGGSIVTISSTEAFTGSFGSAAYSASRAAMHNLVQSWANKYGSYGIRANAVAAGWIGGVMDTDEVFNQSRKITPLGRLGLPHEVASTVKFLCSSDANFISGSVITVDGGYSGVDSIAKFEYQEHLLAHDFHRFTSQFMVGRAGPGDEIWAMSIMFDSEWDEGVETEMFISDQLSAAKRGAKINRVFIVPPKLKKTFNKSHFLVKLHQKHPNIHGYSIDRADLEKLEPGLIARAGDGWTAFNNEFLILDDAGQSGSRGTLITGGEKLNSLRADFEKVKGLAKRL